MVHSSLTLTYTKLACSFPSSSTFTSDSHRSGYLGARRIPRFPRFKILSKKFDGNDIGFADQFSQNNSIADFMRFNIDGNAQLQTAVVSYRKKFPWSILQPFLQVDLMSTIHVADKEYFSTLQTVLGQYDCILYEMVASRESLKSRRNSDIKKKFKNTSSQGFNIIGCIQRQMAKLLMLDFQLDCLDYQAENWYHADLDFETFKSLQRQKGESFFTFAKEMTLRSTKALVASTPHREDLGPWRSKLLWASRVIPMPLIGLLIIGSVCTDVANGSVENPELEALSRLDFSSAMKVFLARRLTSEFTQITSEMEENSVIIGERNKAAVEALDRAINDGHNKIAILYGGGHMPDLGRRLREEFDLIPHEVNWLTAWSIRSKNFPVTSFPFLKKLANVFGWPLNRYQTFALLIFSSVLALDLWFWELFFGTSLDWIFSVTSDLLHYIDAHLVH